jgi:hypothetical protein
MNTPLDQPIADERRPRTAPRAVGCIYEDHHTLQDLRWFWSITVYVDPKQGINTSGSAASLDEAKAHFLSNWQRCRADSTPSGSALYLAPTMSLCPRVLPAGFVAPWLPTNAPQPPSGELWVHEIKHDGFPGYRTEEWPTGEALQPSWQ